MVVCGERKAGCSRASWPPRDVKLGAFGLRLLSILGSVIGWSCVLYSLRTPCAKASASRATARPAGWLSANSLPMAERGDASMPGA